MSNYSPLPSIDPQNLNVIGVEEDKFDVISDASEIVLVKPVDVKNSYLKGYNRNYLEENEENDNYRPSTAPSTSTFIETDHNASLLINEHPNFENLTYDYEKRSQSVPLPLTSPTTANAVSSISNLELTYTVVSEPSLPIQDFISVVDEVRLAISKNTYPKRIYQGSSGSYFCYKLDGGGGLPDGRLGIGKSPSLCAVFKPKNEEPYGNLNPKWTKWLHKNLLPCCFGRSSLIPNVGYLSEVSASLVDRHLELGLVPRTEVVKLASPTFHYSKKDRKAYFSQKKLLPLKLGSFQMFLKGYSNASTFLTENPWPQACVLSGGNLDFNNEPSAQNLDLNLNSNNNNNVKSPNLNNTTTTSGLLEDSFWSVQRQRLFRLQIEKLVIFDYLIRNTDRGLDNWMVKPTATGISVKAIDHGLAFPHKHPDNWRSYPYGWLYLPPSLLNLPFSRTTRDYFLTKLTSSQWWYQLESELTQLNYLDTDFNKKMFEGQLQVLRGQAYNIILSLKNKKDGPIELCRRKQVVVLEIPEDQFRNTSIPLADLNESNIQTNSDGRESKDWPDPFFQQQVSTDTSTKKKVIRKLKTLSKQPCFSFC